LDVVLAARTNGRRRNRLSSFCGLMGSGRRGAKTEQQRGPPAVTGDDDVAATNTTVSARSNHSARFTRAKVSSADSSEAWAAARLSLR
jgi:hypothetical protein